jgi:MFS family permease
MLSQRLKWTVLALVFFGIVISYIDRGNLSIAAGSIMSDLRLEPARMGLLLSVFFWTYAAFQLPSGYLIDRLGIRIVYAVAFTLWSLASASIALSRGPGDIITSRLFLGVAESVGPLASLAFIRRYFETDERGLPTALYIGGQTIGPALGTLLGTKILAHYGWRTLFAATGLGALVWVPLWLVFAPRTGKTQTAQVAEPTPFRFHFALAGCVFLASYFWWFVMTWMPAYMTVARGFSTSEMGKILSIPLFTMAVTNLVSGWAADRIVARTGQPVRVRIVFGSIGLLASSSLLVMNFSASKGVVLPVLLVCICGFGVGSASMWTIAQTLATASTVGRFIGYLNTLSQVAGAAAPLITGWTLGPQKNFHLAIWIAGIAPILAAVCLLCSASRNSRTAKPVTTQTKPITQDAGR